jgi:hypothetical protein
MTSPTHPSNAFAYIDCDVSADQTLAEWRRDRNAARRDERPRRSFRLPRLRRARWTT